MLELIREFGQSGAILLMGIVVGAAWMMAIVSPNVAYDRLEEDDADGHVRQLLKSGSDTLAVLLIAAAAFAVLAGAIGAGITAALAAFGFFTNRWTLSNIDEADDNRPPSKRQRMLAASLTLIFSLVATIGLGLAFFGV
ncbi:MAG: hypothetical protein Hens3KO_10780 [Henriciella sp.]